MIEFLFIGEVEAFNRFPDLVSKSLNGTSEVVQLSDLRQQVIDLKLEQITFLSLKNIEKEVLEDVIPFLLEKVLFLVGNQDDFKKFEVLFEKNKLLLAGFIDIQISPTISLSLVNNAYKYLSLKLKTKEFINLGRDLNELATKTMEETNKLKEIHQQIVPIRKFEGKGVNIFSKFAAGTSAGGEFFDFSINDNMITILLTSTSSYILTSYFLTYMSILKHAQGHNELKKFIEEVSSEVKSLGINLEGASLLFVVIDVSKMSIKGWNFGGSSIHSTRNFYKDQNTFPIDWNFSDKAFFEYQLERQEKLYFISEGMRKNTQMSNISIEQLIIPKQDITMEEEFNEVFYQLKKNRSQKFLDHDATMVILEVLENAIFSI